MTISHEKKEFPLRILLRRCGGESSTLKLNTGTSLSKKSTLTNNVKFLKKINVCVSNTLFKDTDEEQYV